MRGPHWEKPEAGECDGEEPGLTCTNITERLELDAGSRVNKEEHLQKALGGSTGLKHIIFSQSN